MHAVHITGYYWMVSGYYCTIGLVIFALNLLNGQVLFLGEIQITDGF